MALVTISEASRLTGKARKTLYAHIKVGKITAKLDKDSVRKIDTSELVRAYDLQQQGNNKVTTDVTEQVTQGNVTSNTITLTPEQLHIIIKNAVAEAIKEVVPLLLEDKSTVTVEPAKREEIKKAVTPKATTPLNNYTDDLSFLKR